jgi:hypothetical protein
MNGATVQARIYKGMGQAANHVGEAYDVYRFTSPLNPTDDLNKLPEPVMCFFAAEKRFEVPHKSKDAARYLYADGRELLRSDILAGPYGTFFVGDKQPLLPMQAVWCNDVIAIDRIAYIDSAPTPEQIAIGVPCFRQLKKVDQKPVSNTYGATNQATPIAEFFVYLPLDWTLIRQNDVVTDQTSRQYTVSSVDATELCTVLVIRQNDTETGG